MAPALAGFASPESSLDVEAPPDAELERAPVAVVGDTPAQETTAQETAAQETTAQETTATHDDRHATARKIQFGLTPASKTGGVVLFFLARGCFMLRSERVVGSG